MATIDVLKVTGGKAGSIELDDGIFGIEPNVPVMHQVVNAQLAAKSNSDTIKKGVRYLGWFVLVGWSIYPIGYMCMDGGWLSSFMSPESVDVWYNIADAINKIGFGLVVYSIAISETKKELA